MLRLDASELCREALLASMSNTGGEEGMGSSSLRDCFERVLVQSLQAPQDAVRIAQQGLQCLHSSVQFQGGGAEPVELDFAIEAHNNNNTSFSWEPAVFGAKPFELVPSPNEQDLPAQWGDLRNRSFVCLNGLHARAPTRELLRRGATVYLVPADDDDKEQDEQMSDLVRFATEHTCGVLHYYNNSSSLTSTLLPQLAHSLLDRLSRTPNASHVLCNTQHASSLHFSLAADALTEFLCNALTDMILCHVVPSTANLMYLVSNSSGGDATGGATRVQERVTGGGRAPMGSAVQLNKHLGRPDADQREFWLVNGVATKDAEAEEAAMAQLVCQWRIVLARQLGTYRWLTDKRKHRVSVVFALVQDGGEDSDERAGERSIWSLVRDLRHPKASPTVQLDNAYQLYTL